MNYETRLTELFGRTDIESLFFELERISGRESRLDMFPASNYIKFEGRKTKTSLIKETKENR